MCCFLLIKLIMEKKRNKFINLSEPILDKLEDQNERNLNHFTAEKDKLEKSIEILKKTIIKQLKENSRDDTINFHIQKQKDYSIEELFNKMSSWEIDGFDGALLMNSRLLQDREEAIETYSDIIKEANENLVFILEAKIYKTLKE